MFPLPTIRGRVPQPERTVFISDTVRRAQGGDRGAFEQLYRENVAHIYAVCLRITADAVRAREMTQDSFVRAWDMLPSFRGEAAFSSWLHRLAVNVVFVYLRTNRRRESRVTLVEDFSTLEYEDPNVRPGSSIDLEHAVTALPPQARAIFVLHDIEGYKHEEIATQLGIAIGTTKAQLHRARKLLRENLQR